jgi:hypothetical protein
MFNTMIKARRFIPGTTLVSIKIVEVLFVLNFDSFTNYFVSGFRGTHHARVPPEVVHLVSAKDDSITLTGP